jgi:CRP/FNR family cyclic AMP-dependent transcriptional regulator
MSAKSASGPLAQARREAAHHPVMRALPPSAREKVVGRASLVFLAPGEKLYESGATAVRVFVVLSGALQIEYPPRGGTRGPAVAMLPAPAFLGECQVLHRRPWTGTGVALLPLTALALSRVTLEELLLSYPTFSYALYRELSLRFLGAIEDWREEKRIPPEGLLSRYLLSYLKTVELAGAPASEVPLSQQELGRATGLRRETVNRLLRKWAAKRWLSLAPGAVGGVRESALRSLLPAGESSLFVRRLAAEQVLVDLYARWDAARSASAQA